MKINKIGVITLNYNQSEMTIECVHSILKSKYDDYLIHIIDNGSTPENCQILLDVFKGVLIKVITLLIKKSLVQ